MKKEAQMHERPKRNASRSDVILAELPTQDQGPSTRGRTTQGRPTIVPKSSTSTSLIDPSSPTIDPSSSTVDPGSSTKFLDPNFPTFGPNFPTLDPSSSTKLPDPSTKFFDPNLPTLDLSPSTKSFDPSSSTRDPSPSTEFPDPSTKSLDPSTKTHNPSRGQVISTQRSRPVTRSFRPGLLDQGTSTKTLAHEQCDLEVEKAVSFPIGPMTRSKVKQLNQDMEVLLNRINIQSSTVQGMVLLIRAL